MNFDANITASAKATDGLAPLCLWYSQLLPKYSQVLLWRNPIYYTITHITAMAVA